jgi:hypothetical protein
MRITDKNTAIANDRCKQIQDRTETISDGEGVAMVLLWRFLTDHATCYGLDVATLAREQLEAFIPYAEINLKIVREH